MATANATAVEAARAVYALLGMSSNDQGALLEVLEDYFNSSDPKADELDDDDTPSDDEDVDDSFKAQLEGALTITITLFLLLSYINFIIKINIRD